MSLRQLRQLRQLSNRGARPRWRRGRGPGRPVKPALLKMGLLALGLLALPLAAGCGRAPRAGVAPAGGARGAAGAAKEVEVQEDPVKTGVEAGDAGLAGKVRSRLAGDPRLRHLPIEVDAEGGGITLWGHVGRSEDRAAAEQLARQTPGVTSVIDHIKVETPEGPGR
jgi:BON domain